MRADLVACRGRRCWAVGGGARWRTMKQENGCERTRGWVVRRLVLRRRLPLARLVRSWERVQISAFRSQRAPSLARASPSLPASSGRSFPILRMESKPHYSSVTRQTEFIPCQNDTLHNPHTSSSNPGTQSPSPSPPKPSPTPQSRSSSPPATTPNDICPTRAIPPSAPSPPPHQERCAPSPARPRPSHPPPTPSRKTRTTAIPAR